MEGSEEKRGKEGKWRGGESFLHRLWWMDAPVRVALQTVQN